MPYTHSKLTGNTEQNSEDWMLTLCPSAWEEHSQEWQPRGAVSHLPKLGREGELGGGGCGHWDNMITFSVWLWGSSQTIHKVPPGSPELTETIHLVLQILEACD